MNESEIKVVWEKFQDGKSLLEEINNIEETCLLHGCGKIGTEFCNKCEKQQMLYILKRKLELMKEC